MLKVRPLTYRAEIVAPLLTSLNAGECCSVVGINGVGKTNLLQQLRRPEVIAHYVPDAAPLVFINLDTNLLTASDGWGFFEGLAEALVTGLAAVPALYGAVHAELATTHTAILATPGAYPTALRHTTAALALLLAHTRVVIIFDEFDPLFMHVPESVLRNLRGLRDRHKYRLMYLTLTRERLVTLRDPTDWEAVEPFVELFTLRELGLHPLAEADAAHELAHFAARHNHTLAAATIQYGMRLGGGHPALLRALAQAAVAGIDLALTPQTILTHMPALRDECLKIWNDLSGDERDALWHVQGGGSFPHATHADLLLKGLLRPDGQGQFVLFSPLLTAVVAGEIARAAVAPSDEGQAPIRLDQATQRVWLYDEEIGDRLSATQIRLLAYLYAHYGQICPEADLSRAVYPEETFDEESARVGVLVRRLSARLRELAPTKPALIHNMRGRGYRLGMKPAYALEP